MGNLYQPASSSAAADHDRLLQIVRSVRNRWRLRLVVRGLALLLSVGFAVFLMSAFGMDYFRFSPAAVVVFRFLAYGSLLGATVWLLVVPQWRRVSDERVALYLEEREPSLHGQVMSAVEFGGAGDDRDPSVTSPALIRRLVERAIEQCATIDDGRRVERPQLARSSRVLAGVTLMSVALLLFTPAFLRNGAPFLLAPWSRGATENPYSIAVTPGDVTLPRGADLEVTARLHNFNSEVVELAFKRGEGAEWERWSMTVDEETGDHGLIVFKIADHAEYFVEASGVRSPLFRIDVRDLPYVDRINLEYHFPAYTGLSPQRQEDGGDIAALVGTRVFLTVIPTMQVAGGALVVDERDTIPLELGTDTTLTGMLRVRREALYRVVLESVDGTDVVGSPDYYIDVLTDQPPAVWFAQPGRDIQVTSVDEVFAEVRAEDDYGIGQMELLYSVNGGPEQRLDLLSDGRARKQVTAGHTFYLEELTLEPGDFVSYYARATDRNRVAGVQTTTTDIYFMEIRPFDRRYRQAEGGGGGGGGGDVGELSERQRQIVAATFKIVRDTAEHSDKEMRENLATLTLAQGRLREEVATLVRRIEARGVLQLDSTFRTIAEELPRAVEEMESAEEQLVQRRPQDALSPEQRALQHLQRAEAAYRERQVSQGGGGGGGRSDAASAEELADLFDLELDKLRNQYEQVDRGARQQAEEQVDEVLEKLRELARRQQQEVERMRAQAQNQNSGGGGGSRAQRRLAEETEEVARQLERLAREQSRPDLEETARRIREAAEAMRRAAANQRSDGSTQGSAAVERLREARRLLEESRSASFQRDLEDALQRAQRLVEQQEQVARDVGRLAEDTADSADRVRRLIERKTDMGSEVRDLEAQLDRLARDSRQDQPDASRILRDAVKGMRDTRLADKILYSRGVIQGRSPEYARSFEELIESDLRDLEQRLREAQDAVGESRERRLTRSLDRARELVNALESLDERMRGQQEGQSEAERGREGQQGAEGGRGVQEGQGLSPGDQRQFERELRERQQELRELRRELQREGVDVSQLDRTITQIGRLDNLGPIGHPRGLAELRDQVIPGLKEFEYMLRRQLLGADAAELFLSGSDEVPPEYRKLVEEYYKSLARERR